MTDTLLNRTVRSTFCDVGHVRIMVIKNPGECVPPVIYKNIICVVNALSKQECFLTFSTYSLTNPTI